MQGLRAFRIIRSNGSTGETYYNSFEDVKIRKNIYFMRMGKNSTNEIAFKYVLSKVKSKGKEIDYGNELKSQNY